MVVVLFFHGYGQNGKFFKERRRLEKLEKEFIKHGHYCFFLDGAYRAHTIDNGCTSPCSWYAPTGIETNDIHQLLESFSPMNLILIGFSQGGVYIDAILRYYNKYREKFSCHIVSALFCACHGNEYFHYSIPSIPTFHIWGIYDDCVDHQLSKKLYEKYAKKHARTQHLVHTKKHIFPIDPKSVDTILNFVKYVT